VIMNDNPSIIGVAINSLATLSFGVSEAVLFQRSNDAPGRYVTKLPGRWALDHQIVTATNGSSEMSRGALLGSSAPAR